MPTHPHPGAYLLSVRAAVVSALQPESGILEASGRSYGFGNSWGISLIRISSFSSSVGQLWATGVSAFR